MTFGKGGTFKTQPACIPFPVFSSLLPLFWRSCLHPSGKRQPDRPSFFPISAWWHLPDAGGSLFPMGRLLLATAARSQPARGRGCLSPGWVLIGAARRPGSQRASRGAPGTKYTQTSLEPDAAQPDT